MSEIKEFFANRTILLTGVTGMMGKLILAKLMRLGNVKEVVLIVREKKNQTAVERIDLMMNEFLFEESDKYDSEFRKKLKVLNGDVQLLDLGLSNDDQAYIKSHVEIVLHGAATIKFTESLKRAVETNLRGTKALLDLAKDMKHLVSFIHVSTAFSQCYREDLKECFYTTPVTGEFVMSLCEKFDENLICTLTPQIIYPWPNTYAFSKALVEDYIRRHKDGLPIAIIRPSIIQATFSDPVTGYIDNLFGVNSLFVGVASGILRVIKIKREAMASHLDLIPADVAVNSALIVARETSKLPKGDCRIYNNVTFNIYRASGYFFEHLMILIGDKFPLKNMLWYPTLTIIDNDYVFKFCFFLYHYVPGLLVDLCLMLAGRKLRLFKIYNMIWINIAVLDYFFNRNYRFEDSNMRQLYENMNKLDHSEFPVTIETQHLMKYASRTIDGARKHLFKMTAEDCQAAAEKVKYLKIAHYTFITIFYTAFALFVNSFLSCLWSK